MLSSMLSTNVSYLLIQTIHVGAGIASYLQLRRNNSDHFSLDSVSYILSHTYLLLESKGGKIGMAQSATKPNSAYDCE